MTHGKNICKQLKEVRKRIAEENDIPLEIEECTYKGECRGTCPKCEAEVRYLENTLAERLKLGKVATVAGLALGLAATTTAQAAEKEPPAPNPPSHHHETYRDMSIQADSVTVRGTVIEERNGEPVPFANVLVLTPYGRDTVARVSTDFDGKFEVVVPKGLYALQVKLPGLWSWARMINVNEDTDMGTINLEAMVVGLMEVEVVTQGMPLDTSDYELGTDAPTQKLEREGVKVIVR